MDMPEMTRDSWAWVVLTIGGALGYLVLQPPPTEWGYYDWLQHLGVGAIWLGSQLGNSPLKGERKGL